MTIATMLLAAAAFIGGFHVIGLMFVGAGLAYLIWHQACVRPQQRRYDELLRRRRQTIAEPED